MFSALFSRAESAAQEIAKDAGLLLLVVVLQFGAVLFIFGGIAWGLTYVMAPPLALALTGAGLGLTAAIVLMIKRRNGDHNESEREKSQQGAVGGQNHPLATALQSVGSMGSVVKTLDVVATGLFTRQLRRRPVSTVAATVAVGMLVGMLANLGDDDD